MHQVSTKMRLFKNGCHVDCRQTCCIPARYASVCYQRSGSYDLPSFSVWSCFVAAEGASLVASAWGDRVQALCTRTQVSERLWAGLPCWQSSTSDGRPVTSTAVIFVVIADRPGDTSCNTGRPCGSCRRRPGLERPTKLRHVSANLLIIPYRVEVVSVFPDFLTLATCVTVTL